MINLQTLRKTKNFSERKKVLCHYTKSNAMNRENGAHKDGVPKVVQEKCLQGKKILKIQQGLH